MKYPVYLPVTFIQLSVAFLIKNKIHVPITDITSPRETIITIVKPAISYVNNFDSGQILTTNL